MSSFLQIIKRNQSDFENNLTWSFSTTPFNEKGQSMNNGTYQINLVSHYTATLTEKSMF